MVCAGFEAEAMDHHPDRAIVHNRAAVRLNTHDSGGKVTAKDVELAQRFEKIAWVKRVRTGPGLTVLPVLPSLLSC